jgi:hydroxymethylpyrimidine pyrophosphatase-like HAD family hydrolase
MKCSSLESLLVDCRSEIIAEIRRQYVGAHAEHLILYLSQRRCKLGYYVGRPVVSKSLPFEQWSPKFQKQWHTYEKLVATGVSRDSPLGKMATHYKMSVGKSKTISVDNYKEAIGTGLFHCQPLPEDWGIEDLLSLDVRTTAIAGLEHSESYNSFVDRYRTREQNRESKVKRKGFNSAIFEQFTSALTAVARFNGLFNLVEPFSRAYRSNLDVESTRLNKDAKKKLFSIAAIDENIARLELEFNQIVKDKSFERRAGVSTRETDKKMRLCLFLPLFTALRFLGLRQKNIRNFRLMGDPENRNDPDGNVGFRKDDTLVIHFTKYETKNGKPLHLEFSLPGFETHAPLIRILKTYYKKVYPYIRNNAASSLDRQFFAHMPRKFPGKFAFLPDRSKAIDQLFERWGNESLRFRNITAKNFRILNPHHLRGTCVDWLVKDLHFSLVNAAEYIADTPEMLKKEYLDRNRVHDATFILEEKNRDLRAGQAEKEALEDALRAAEQAKIEAAKRAERDDVQYKQMNRMEDMLNRLDSANSALVAENALLKELLAKKSGAGATTP